MSISSTKENVVEINENKLVLAAAIIPFSMAGTLVRIALTNLQDYPGMPVFSLVYAQWVGCLIMGMAVKNKDSLFFWYHPSLPAITSGLCGSITTFSSWQLGIFKEFANYNAYPHTQGKNILAALSEFIVTLAMSLNGLVIGQHVGEVISTYFSPMTSYGELKVIPRGYSFKYLSKLDYVTILLGILSWLGVIFAAIFAQDQKELALACVFAPVGALTRWHLSFYNVRIPRFPIGTFLANVSGTAILAVLTLVQSGVQMTSISCTVVQALADGYCGCLTTISTFMVELSALSRKQSYHYGMVSVVVAQCLMFVILGSYIWSNGVNFSCPYFIFNASGHT